MTPREPAQTEPSAAKDAMGQDGVAQVVGARRFEPAGTGKQR
jgi:hypothetical protein